MEQEALYTIGQVSKICDVSQRMLRYYEKVGLIRRLIRPAAKLNITINGWTACGHGTAFWWRGGRRNGTRTAPLP